MKEHLIQYCPELCTLFFVWSREISVLVFAVLEKSLTWIILYTVLHSMCLPHRIEKYDKYEGPSCCAILVEHFYNDNKKWQYPGKEIIVDLINVCMRF